MSAARLNHLATSLALLLVLGMSAVAKAAAPVALGYDNARMLLDRSGFGPTPAEIARFSVMTREQAVRTLLAETRTTAMTPPPAWTTDAAALAYPRGPDASEAERKAFAQRQVREGLELRGWWIGEMRTTTSPLTERMTLFWHNHFVSSQQKVKLAVLMYQQNVTLRAQALGNFSTLLHAIARDPAMVIYLDSAQNRKGAPNENFAREVMELFTLGEGHYTEQDVKEAARAFTGWSLDRSTGQFVFRRFVHDDGDKTVLGRSGNLDGDQVLDILLAQPQTSEFIVRKLWREFVSPDPDDAEVRRIARLFRDSGYDIKTAMQALLTCDAFYAPANRGTLVKSPVELVVGTLRQFDLHPADPLPFAVAAAGMGQNLFSPPNVKGWPGQDAWINSSTLLARKRFLDRVFRADGAPGPGMLAVADVPAMAPMPRQALAPAGAQDVDRARQVAFRRAMDRALDSVQFDSSAWFATLSVGTESQRTAAAERFLLAIPPQAAPDPAADPLTVVRALVLDVTYQLK
jgi:uncharacterized protein (DUF1800 family)